MSLATTILAFYLIMVFTITGCQLASEQIQTDLDAPAAVQMSGHNEKVANKAVEDRSLPGQFRLHSIPHNRRPQRGTDCAPDSLRMVLNHYKKGVTEGEVVKQLDDRGRSGGVTFTQLAAIARGYDLEAYIIYGLNIETLKTFLLNGWPPIVSHSIGRGGHAIVVVGYDDAKRRLLVHDPWFPRVKRFHYHDFVPVWKHRGNRALLVVPKGVTKRQIITAVGEHATHEIQ